MSRFQDICPGAYLTRLLLSPA